MNTTNFPLPELNHSATNKTPRILVGIFVLLVLGFVGYRGISRARTHKQLKACQENLVKFDGAKEQWALENNKPEGTWLTIEELMEDLAHGGYLKAPPLECPSGRGVYVLNAIGSDPTCTSGLPGHSLSAYHASFKYVTHD